MGHAASSKHEILAESVRRETGGDYAAYVECMWLGLTVMRVYPALRRQHDRLTSSEVVSWLSETSSGAHGLLSEDNLPELKCTALRCSGLDLTCQYVACHILTFLRLELLRETHTQSKLTLERRPWRVPGLHLPMGSLASFGPLVCAEQSSGDCPVEPCASECAYFSVVAARDGGRHEQSSDRLELMKQRA